MKNRIIAVSAAVMVAIPFINAHDTNAVNFTMRGTINSESAIIANLDCDTVIHEKNADTKQFPGHLVNIMTAIVCIENCSDLSAEVTIDEDVYSYLYNTEYPDDLRYGNILHGDILTYNDLLYAMMLTSSVEASETIAYNVGGGDVSVFVEMMNKKAKEIGMESTNFTNATGMYNPEQYTTARDMLKLTQYALRKSHFEDICSTYVHTPAVPNFDRHPIDEKWRWFNSNIMMDEENEKYYYKGVKGIKTGNLELGGRNIVAMASKDGHNYLVIGMKAPINDEEDTIRFYHLDDAKQMFNWAFNNFSYEVVLADTAELGELPVELADGSSYVLAKPVEEVSLLWNNEVDLSLISKDNITWYNKKLQAPIKKGEPLGRVTLEYSGEKLADVELVAVADVERSVLKYNTYAAKLFLKSSWFKNSLIIAGVLSVLYIILCVYAYVLYKSHSKPLKPMYAVPKVDKEKTKNNSNTNK
ncbi:MAG: D-alanyl-D-alanine carboxypeptidase [Ruminococcus sp.]|nr:D-alanyl-D-alanine carboxypeptidase [Ruminococcus sp.]